MNRKRFFSAAALGLVLALAWAVPHASAYIDPGTGSYLFQIMIAFLVAAAFSIKMFWKKIATFFRKIFSGKTDTGPHAS